MFHSSCQPLSQHSAQHRAGPTIDQSLKMQFVPSGDAETSQLPFLLEMAAVAPFDIHPSIVQAYVLSASPRA